MTDRVIVPDGIEPITGWRLWKVRGMFVSSAYLESWARSTAWPHGYPLPATCELLDVEQRHPPGDDTYESCSCGVYAKQSLADLLAEYEPLDRGALTAIGEVHLWGTVIVGEHGYRASRAYPRRIWVLAPRDASGMTPQEMAERAARELADLYRIPAFAATSLLQVAEMAEADEESRRWAGMTRDERMDARGVIPVPVIEAMRRLAANVNATQQQMATLTSAIAATAAQAHGGVQIQLTQAGRRYLDADVTSSTTSFSMRLGRRSLRWPILLLAVTGTQFLIDMAAWLTGGARPGISGFAAASLAAYAAISILDRRRDG